MANKEINKGKSKKDKLFNLITNEFFLVAVALAIIVLIVVGIVYYNIQGSRIYTDNAHIEAPVISLSPTVPGVLQKIYVNVGDKVYKNMIVAKVGNQSILAKTDGVITAVDDVPGELIMPGTSVVEMLNPAELRVVGLVDENAGLSSVKVGQKVVFTADAFGSKQYPGVVSSIGETAHQGDIVFSISGKREESQFAVKAKFDVSAYSELKNGMSARMWIYK